MREDHRGGLSRSRESDRFIVPMMAEPSGTETAKLGLLEQWLTAVVMEEQQWQESEPGVPQGAGISPRLANIFLH